MEDEFASFRATYPTVRAALDACTRPDWLVLLAWEALDHKTAADVGLGAARILNSDGLWWFVNPSPNRLETVQAWAGTEDDTTRVHATGRAIALSGLPGAALAYVVEYQLLPSVYAERDPLRYAGLMAVLAALCVPVLRAVLGAVVRRRAARLDDTAVLDILLRAIRTGMVAQPRLVKVVVNISGRRVKNLVDGETK